MNTFIAKITIAFLLVIAFATLSTCIWTQEDLENMVSIRVCQKNGNSLLFELGADDAYPLTTESGLISGYVISQHVFCQKFPSSENPLHLQEYTYFICYKDLKLGKELETEFKLAYNRVLLFRRKDSIEMDHPKKLSVSFENAPESLPEIRGYRAKLWIQRREFSTLVILRKSLEKTNFSFLQSFPTVKANGVLYASIFNEKATETIYKRAEGVPPANGDEYIEAATFLVLQPRPTSA